MAEPDPSALLTFNGINGATGDYALPPMTDAELFKFIRGAAQPTNLAELQYRQQQRARQQLGVKEGVDPKKLAEAGWGIVFPAQQETAAIQEALTALLNLRQQQAGAHFRLYTGSAGYRPGETKSAFLARHGAGPGPADPDKVPYYLLLVGSPAEIPYSFQYQLDVQYAVGRIHFDKLVDYHQYANSVVAVESAAPPLPRKATFFGVANADDGATQLSTKLLVNPLLQKLAARNGDWQFDAFLGDQATKTRLATLLGGSHRAPLLFSASHGMGFPLGDPRQLAQQGALLCQDWPGPQQWHGPIPHDFYFAGEDLASTANLQGVIAFFFACYGAGTPAHDDFAKQAFQARKPIAPYPFVAQLPAKLLSNPGGGALAVIGHVERAWSYSFLWPGASGQTTVFESALQRLLAGHPIGSAMEYFNQRYAELAADLSVELEEIAYGKPEEPYALAGMWTANNDARSYAIIGDPAVRLLVAATES